MNCSLCQQELIRNLSLIELFSAPSLCCSACLQKFSRIDPKTACLGCGRPQLQKALCSDCQKWQTTYPQLLENTALFTYDDVLKNWMQRYKFEGDYHLRFIFASELKQQLQAFHGYLICPIPLTEDRFNTRGFNQVNGLLSAAKCKSTELLARPEPSLPQSKKTRQERLQLMQPFVLTIAPEKIKNKRVLLVDDVYTTGRTLFHAADIFWQNGVKVVKSLTLAR